MKQETIVPVALYSRRRSFLGWLGKIGFGLLVLVVCLAPIGSIYQSIASRQDLQRFPPPGQMVDLGGFRLHLHCTGSSRANPTVVLESGLGDGAFSWALVQPQVAQTTRVCSYDRPGLGWSDFVDQAIQGDEVARNLHALLDRAGEKGPYILVGHSAGGIYVRDFARLYPQEVAGMVLVDSAHESQVLRYEQRLQMGSSPLQGLLRACEVIAPTGFLRLTGVTALTLSDSALPQHDKLTAAAWMNRTTYCRTIENELRATDVDMSQAAGPPPLGSLPLIVLTGGRGFESGGQGELIWERLQGELVALSSRGKQIIAQKSGHYIQWTQPELVIQAILSLLNKSS